jgi:hypothetical protein
VVLWDQIWDGNMIGMNEEWRVEDDVRGGNVAEDHMNLVMGKP